MINAWKILFFMTKDMKNVIKNVLVINIFFFFNQKSAVLEIFPYDSSDINIKSTFLLFLIIHFFISLSRTFL